MVSRGMASFMMIRSLVICVTIITSSTHGFLVNARGKPATASTVLDQDFLPGKAVDGDTYSVFPNVFHTALYLPSNWWSVDMGSTIMSPGVSISFRRFYKARRNGIRISLSPYHAGRETVCHYVSGAADGSNIDDVYSFTCGGRGRYVTISTETDNDGKGAALDFGEVLVWACSLYTFGSDCLSECHCAGDSCNWRNPVCYSGCTAGWKSAACDQLVSTAEVSVYTKNAEICDVPVSYNLEAVSLTSVREMESLDLETRIECLHKCEALILCFSFEYTSQTCTLWRSGSSGVSGSRDMYKK